PPTTEARSTRPLHAALPLSPARPAAARIPAACGRGKGGTGQIPEYRHRAHPAAHRPPARDEPDAGPARLAPRHRLPRDLRHAGEDRKSTRLNSSHVKISYAV